MKQSGVENIFIQRLLINLIQGIELNSKLWSRKTELVFTCQTHSNNLFNVERRRKIIY